ncbi:hypothetical protein Pla22_42510 [Rubripirellula amarantea]|uniref:Uncharacterized protein n=1 Tax=Rubripirellula amarantea TaxID=2527999 RepID=A0A5C5WN89_9BACT|nr:hypothetical protein [Rubripirellula amarantea]TWT51473.1 hypothetical protein Pla22_42510 [Rubripirellula amarantea]
MLASLALTIIVCYIWIACDPWMQEAFLVYGRAFCAAIEMKAWGIMFRCGWRLLVVLTVIVSVLGFAADAVLIDPGDITRPLAFAWATLVVFAVALLPWPFVIAAYRYRREIDGFVDELSPIAVRIAGTTDLDDTFDPAHYENDGDWIAWHPSTSEFNAADKDSVWRRIAPVFYTSPSHPGSVVFAIDWSSFAVWGNLPPLPPVGCYLSFRGPGSTKFRHLSSRRSKTQANCWVIRADMDMHQEAGNQAVHRSGGVALSDG